MIPFTDLFQYFQLSLLQPKRNKRNKIVDQIMPSFCQSAAVDEGSRGDMKIRIKNLSQAETCRDLVAFDQRLGSSAKPLYIYIYREDMLYYISIYNSKIIYLLDGYEHHDSKYSRSGVPTFSKGLTSPKLFEHFLLKFPDAFAT